MTKNKRVHYDEIFKIVYTSPEPTADLVKASIREKWADELDMRTLELVPTEHVGESLGVLRSDLIWSVRWRKETLYIYVMVEFQSSPDPTMPLRMVEYVAALYRSLIRSRKIDRQGPYPPVYSLILYHGTPPWLVQRNIVQMLGPIPDALRPYNLSLKYSVIDVRRWAANLPADTENLAEAMLRVQSRVRPEDLVTAAVAMLEMLGRTGRTSLWSAFRPWMRELFLRQFPRLQWPKRASLEEILGMLKSETIDWQPEWHDPGVELGREQGLEQGASALRRTLSTFAKARFGQSVAALVAAAVAEIRDVDRLEEVSRWLGECDDGEELVNRLRGG